MHVALDLGDIPHLWGAQRPRVLSRVYYMTGGNTGGVDGRRLLRGAEGELERVRARWAVVRVLSIAPSAALVSSGSSAAQAASRAHAW